MILQRLPPGSVQINTIDTETSTSNQIISNSVTQPSSPKILSGMNESTEKVGNE